MNRGLVRGEWLRKVEERRTERAREGRHVSVRAKLAPAWWERLWRPFEIFRPEESEEGAGVSVFEALGPRIERRPAEGRYGGAGPSSYARPEPPRPAPPYARPGQAPLPPYVRRQPEGGPPPAREGRPSVSREYVDSAIHLDRLFEHVRAVRKDPQFKGAAGIGVLAPAGIDPWGKALKVIEFFGVPESAYKDVPRDEVWKRLLEPLLAAVAGVIDSARPQDIPGRFRFGGSPSGAFGLVYEEARP